MRSGLLGYQSSKLTGYDHRYRFLGELWSIWTPQVSGAWNKLRFPSQEPVRLLIAHHPTLNRPRIYIKGISKLEYLIIKSTQVFTCWYLLKRPEPILNFGLWKYLEPCKSCMLERICKIGDTLVSSRTPTPSACDLIVLKARVDPWSPQSLRVEELSLSSCAHFHILIRLYMGSYTSVLNDRDDLEMYIKVSGKI